MILAIDTATDIASVALRAEHRIHAARSAPGARRHAAQIVPLVQQVLEQAGVRPADLTGLIVGDGPGSFTGLRIAWAVAKGLAHDHRLPIRAIQTLLGAAHLAAQAYDATREFAAADDTAAPMAACLDALRGEVFGAVYAFPPGRVETLVAPGLFTIDALRHRVPARPRLAVGDGAVRYGDAVLNWIGRPAIGLDALPPLATSLLMLAEREGAVRPIDDPATAEPIYGRPAEAQVKWEARHGRPLPHSTR